MAPSATYRLQLHAGFRFTDATDIVDYLAELGISHAYASPYLAAVPGSTHGYNIVDPSRLNPEIGDTTEFIAWTDRLASRGMGHIVDVVPNHMAASLDNAWWADVLENGPASRFSEHFDVEWHPLKEALHDRVLLPVLGAQYGEVLEKGELTLVRNGGSFTLRYYERSFPVNPRTVATMLGRVAATLTMPSEDPLRQDFESIVLAVERLPPRASRAPEERIERAREKEVLKRRLAAACADPRIATAVDAEVRRMNGTPGDPRSFDDLDELIVAQAYRLAYWRVATEEINYRRFFDINDLAAIRMEHPVVFDDVHRLLVEHVNGGRIQGLRLDHTDGLYDPEAYFSNLRRAVGGRSMWIVAEKILAPSEELPAQWEIDGTTGYDFLAQATSVLVDPRGEESLTKTYQTITGDDRTYAAHVLDAKRSILRVSLSSELNMLAQRLERIAMKDRRSRDFTLATLRRAIAETTAAFPVYRTYIRPNGDRGPNDEQIVRRAIHLARKRNPEVNASVFEFLRDVLLFEKKDDPERAELVMRFQQLTGPVAAKGVEDTSFYTYVRFLPLNEVGGRPDRFGATIADLHASSSVRRNKWPRAMTSTSTHDTKRGEDIRARLAVLSEIPEEWRSWVDEWRAIGAKYTTTVEEEVLPTGTDQYLFFQTVLGAAPLEPDPSFLDRLVAFAEKAAREAKQRTSWLSTDEAYENALQTFIRGTFADEAFQKSLAEKVHRIATHGAANSLAQVVLKIASPGIPDTYQGSETWDFRLVDPDNRRPVDYAKLRAVLRSLEDKRPTLDGFEDGRIKLHVVSRCLRVRRSLPEVFLDGTYEPLDAGDEIIAFVRNHERARVVAAVSRFPARKNTRWAIGDVWGDRMVAVPAGRYRDALTGKVHDVREGTPAKELFAELPVALLVST